MAVRSAARNHRYVVACSSANILSCWEVNMGFMERGKIEPGFNDCDSWKEIVTPCCHCTVFKQDHPLIKKLRKVESYHDESIAARYKCQSLWKATRRPPVYNSKRAREDVTTPQDPVNKKPKSGISPSSNMSVRLVKSQQENAQLQRDVSNKDLVISALRSEKEAWLLEKNRSLKQVEVLTSERIQHGSLSVVKKLEGIMKEHLQMSINNKYVAVKLANLVSEEAYGGICGLHLHKTYYREIQTSNPYHDAMEVCRVMDLGSGQLNFSGIEMLRKGIEGDATGKVQYGGGWLTTKYHIQEAQKILHSAAKEEIPYHEIPDPELDGFAFKVGVADDYSKLLIFLLEMFKLDGIAKDSTQAPVQIACTLDGADISRNVSHVTAGIKILDPRAIDPISHLPIGMDGSKKV
jgi:hypothetical protein